MTARMTARMTRHATGAGYVSRSPSASRAVSAFTATAKRFSTFATPSRTGARASLVRIPSLVTPCGVRTRESVSGAVAASARVTRLRGMVRRAARAGARTRAPSRCRWGGLACPRDALHGAPRARRGGAGAIGYGARLCPLRAAYRVSYASRDGLETRGSRGPGRLSPLSYMSYDVHMYVVYRD